MCTKCEEMKVAQIQLVQAEAVSLLANASHTLPPKLAIAVQDQIYKILNPVISTTSGEAQSAEEPVAPDEISILAQKLANELGCTVGVYTFPKQ